MKLRKIVSISLVVILLSTFLTCAIPVSAATNNIISSDSNLEAIAGSTISVPIRIANNQGLMGYDMNFTYDEKVLTPIEVTQGNIFTEGFFEDDISGKTSTNNSFRVFWANANQYTENGVLFYLKFSVDSQATGETEIIIDYDKSATFNENYSGVLLNCSSIRMSIKNNEYDGKPVFSIVGTDIAAGNILSLDFYAENLGSTKSVVFTVPYDNANFRYSSIILNGVKATAIDNGDSVSINVSDLSKASAGKILTLQMQSEFFATAKSYSFFPQYNNLQGVDKVLIKGTEITVTPTTESDSIVIYTNEINATGYGENQLVIPLYIKHNTGLMGFTFTFNYDPSVLEIDSAKMSDSFKGKFFTDIESKKSGQFTCLWFENENVYSNGDFLTLTFNVLAQNESTGNITISYNEKDIISEKTDGVKVDVPIINYLVNTIIYLLGDVDGDGRVSITDATVIQKYLAEYILPHPDVIKKCGDADGDGRITITDATTIQKYLAEYFLPYEIGKPII